MSRHVEIGRLRTLSSIVRSRKSKYKKIRNGASALDVLYSMQYLTTWADSSCLSLYKAMREPDDEIGDK